MVESVLRYSEHRAIVVQGTTRCCACTYLHIWPTGVGEVHVPQLDGWNKFFRFGTLVRRRVNRWSPVDGLVHNRCSSSCREESLDVGGGLSKGESCDHHAEEDSEDGTSGGPLLGHKITSEPKPNRVDGKQEEEHKRKGQADQSTFLGTKMEGLLQLVIIPTKITVCNFDRKTSVTESEI